MAVPADALVVIRLGELEEAIERAVEKALGRANEQGVTIAEAASRLKVSTRTIERWIKSGEIASVKVGGSVRLPLSDVLRKAG